MKSINPPNIYRNSFARFAVVGFFGVLCNLLIFYIAFHVFSLGINFSAVIAFAFAVTQNYYFNHIWSFEFYVDSKPNPADYFKYVLVNLIGLAVNLLVLNVLVVLFVDIQKVVAQFFGIFAGLLANYVGSYIYVFVKKYAKNNKE